MGEFWLECGDTHLSGESVTLLLRPQARLAAEGEISGKVADVVFRGEQFRVELENGLYFHLDERVSVGDVVKLNILRLECL
ncbi:MAG: hypothetical protein EHM81_06090 [Chloroflexi bacterium]|nr:MAG: hypothetical protein EHM81_06090 [Chloroflexota bacterium]